MAESCRILIAEPDAIASAALAETLSRQGYACERADSAERVMASLERNHASRDERIGVLIVDQDLGGVSGGLALIRQLKDERRPLVPIVTSAFRKVESAVQAMRCGSADYLLKPLIESELIEAVERAVQHHLLQAGHVQAPPPNDSGADGEQEDPSAYNGTRVTDIDEPAGPWKPMPLAEAMQGPERQILLTALKANGWNRGETARQLDINRTTLYKKIRQYRLDEPL